MSETAEVEAELNGPQPSVDLTTGAKLDMDSITAFVEVIEQHAGNDVLVLLPCEDGTADPDAIVHEIVAQYIGESDRWIYSIPLKRHLTAEEGNQIATEWADWSNAIEGDFEISASTPPVDPKDFPQFDSVDVDETYPQLYLETTDPYKHNRWIENMMDKGWRFGVSHDNQMKMSPLLKPWHDLSEGQRRHAKRYFDK